MPKGPKDQKRPADVGSNTIPVARIAAGEEDDAPPVADKDPNDAAKGKKDADCRAID